MRSSGRGNMAEIQTIEASGKISHIALTGRLDIDGVGRIEIPLTAATVARGQQVIIDMTRVDFLGSLGIGLLVRCAVSLQRQGARLVVFGCQPLVRKSLEITKVNALVLLADSEAQARELVATK